MVLESFKAYPSESVCWAYQVTRYGVAIRPPMLSIIGHGGFSNHCHNKAVAMQIFNGGPWRPLLPSRSGNK